MGHQENVVSSGMLDTHDTALCIIKTVASLNEDGASNFSRTVILSL
jgi:hypothetical protein